MGRSLGAAEDSNTEKCIGTRSNASECVGRSMSVRVRPGATAGLVAV